MTLVTPEGTEIPVTGATNKKTSGEVLTTTTSQVEVFASIDGKFYDYDDASTFSNRAALPDTQGVGQYIRPFLRRLTIDAGHHNQNCPFPDHQH